METSETPETPVATIVYKGNLEMVKEIRGVLDGAGLGAQVLQPGSGQG